MDNIDKEVLKMRRAYKNGDPISEISQVYGWSPRNARNAISGVTFKHVPEEIPVVSGKNNASREQEMITAICNNPRQRGWVTQFMKDYGITYETFRRLRAIALDTPTDEETVD